MKNWKTTSAAVVGAIAWGLAHETYIIPLLPDKYHALANTIFVIAGALLGLCSKDAGNHAAAAPQADAQGAAANG
jgi:hypothetical protein